MPAPLWQYADYLQYANHPSPLVREWALDGLEYHYPEQGLPAALKLLGDPEEQVFQTARQIIKSRQQDENALAAAAALPK